MASKEEAPLDENAKPTVIGVSKIDLETPVPIAVDPDTNAVIVEVAE